MQDAIVVGSKLHQVDIVHYQRCGYQIETKCYALWDCFHASKVWLRILRLLCHLDIDESVSWGIAVWGCTDKFLFSFDSLIQCLDNEGFLFDRGKVFRRTISNTKGQLNVSSTNA
jgi:hypothetical protein